MAQPLHAQIAAELRQQIKDRALAPGEKLPSEAELSNRYNVSRVTVRHALRTLEQEGLVVARAGVGRVVKATQPMVYRPQDERAPRISTELDRYMSYLTRQGRRPSQTIAVAVEPAPEPVAERFAVEPGTPVVVRKRVRSLDGEPFNINDTYYRQEAAAGTAAMDPADIPQGSNSVIEAVLGPEVRAVDEIYIRMPDPEETQRLEIDPGTPVAVHYVTGYTASEQVVRVDRFVLPGDRHVIQYERRHDEVSR